MKKSKTKRNKKRNMTYPSPIIRRGHVNETGERVMHGNTIPSHCTMVDPSKCKSCFTCDSLEVVKGKETNRVGCKKGIRHNIKFLKAKNMTGILAPKSCGRHYSLAKIHKKEE